MDENKLKQIAVELSKPPKGILAADESTNTISKRFKDIKVESSFETRRKYRELLFKTKDLNKFISGVILFDETLRQSTSQGVPFAKYLDEQNIYPGIKVDTGTVPINPHSDEKVTEGLDGLGKRLEEYKDFGAAGSTASGSQYHIASYPLVARKETTHAAGTTLSAALWVIGGTAAYINRSYERATHETGITTLMVYEMASGSGIVDVTDGDDA